jgi:hypothetical protein
VGDKIGGGVGLFQPAADDQFGHGEVMGVRLSFRKAARISEGEMHELHESCAGDCPEK